MADIVIEDDRDDGVEAAAEAVESAAEAVESAAEATEVANDSGSVDSVDLSVEHRLTVLELDHVSRAEFESLAQSLVNVSETATDALVEASNSVDLNDVEEMIEATDFTEDKDGEIEADAPDVPPAGIGTSILFDSWSGLKSRMGKKASEQ